MKHLGKLAVLGAVFATTVPFASAVTYTLGGQVWTGAGSGLCDNVTLSCSHVPVEGSSVYGTTPAGYSTFTLTGTNPALINFNSYGPTGSGNPNMDYTVGTFLTSANPNPSGNSVADTVTGLNPTVATTNLDLSLFRFAGSVTLASGMYTFQHDDGLLLYLNGTLVVNEGGPTSATNTTLCVGTTGCNYNISSSYIGTDSFILDFAEVNGTPAVLDTNLPLLAPSVPTPEPSSLMLLGTGLVGAAGMLFRRRFTA